MAECRTCQCCGIRFREPVPLYELPFAEEGPIVVAVCQGCNDWDPRLRGRFLVPVELDS